MRSDHATTGLHKKALTKEKTMDIPIAPSSTEHVNSTPQQISVPGGYLGKEQFLQLLVAQLSHQDPLNPVDNTESIAQLAQFSALEQMQNVSTQLEGLRQASGLIDGLMLHGKEVELITGDGEKHQGTVERVAWGQDGLTITLNGIPIPLSSVIEVRQPEQPQQDSGQNPGNE